MARRFRGESQHKVDSKGRVSIPSFFRRVLEAGDPDWTEGLRPQLVIVYGDHRRKFLECYTIEAIDEVDDKISKLPRGSIERRMLERLFHGQSIPTEVDGDGRLVLPQKLRERSVWTKRRSLLLRVTPSRSGTPKPMNKKNWPRPKHGWMNCPRALIP